MTAGLTPKGQNTRRRIVDAAIELFAERGYHATTIAEIGERSGAQRGALYHHIKAKEDLLFEVVRGHLEAVLEAASTIAAAPLAPRDKLNRLIHAQAETLMARRRELTIYERDRRALSAERQAEVRALQGRVDAIWAAVLGEGVTAGELRAVDPVVVKTAIGAVNCVYRWYRPSGRLSAEQIAAEIADFVLRGLQ